jgi:hypothetical protein
MSDVDESADASGSPISGTALEQGLRRLGHTSFRPGQREAVETLLREGRVLLVAPTGGGKSLTYQLPALLLRGTTLVISPLIALMHDQVRALEECGVRATYLAATLEPDELRRPRRGRRGALHQRVGPRLPAGVSGDRCAVEGAARGACAGVHRHGHARRT